MLYGDSKQSLAVDHGVVNKAIRFLVEVAPALPDGRRELGDGMFAELKKYRPVPAAERRFETHIRYADVQCVLAGAEIVQVTPLADLGVVEDRLAAADVRFHQEPAADAVWEYRLAPGSFLLLLPEDAHKPECFCGILEGRKAIVKILVSLLLGRS